MCVCNYFLGTVVYSLFDLKWDYFFIGEDGWLKNAVNFDDFGERVVLSVVDFVESIDFTMVYGCLRGDWDEYFCDLRCVK